MTVIGIGDPKGWGESVGDFWNLLTLDDHVLCVLGSYREMKLGEKGDIATGGLCV